MNHNSWSFCVSQPVCILALEKCLSIRYSVLRKDALILKVACGVKQEVALGEDLMLRLRQISLI